MGRKKNQSKKGAENLVVAHTGNALGGGESKRDIADPRIKGKKEVCPGIG